MTDTVRSADGTTIAFDRSGDGPPLIVVTGAFCDRSSPRNLAAKLAPRFTVFCYDRRGRGSSGDTAPYSVDSETEDLDALVSAAGGEAFVFGHSSGAVLALEAAAQGIPITKLAVYEPPFVVDGSRARHGADLADRLRQLVSDGHPGPAAELFLVEAVGVSPDVVAMIQAGPGWPGMEALAHTLAYDVTVCNGQSMPADRMANIRVPTLAVAGGASPDWARNSVATLAATIPGAQHLTLDGQDHGVADEVIAPVLVEFFS
jgi:pimeloyl-ACP methyl ester carboxylesterase